jgi:prophage regulatory protein
MVEKILRKPCVLAAAGIGKSTLHNRIQGQLWTKPVRLGARSVGWPEGEVAALNRARVRGLTESEIQSLVRQLESARKELA